MKRPAERLARPLNLRVSFRCSGCSRNARTAAHPMGAAAQRHPHIRIDHGRYIASTARSIKGGVIGFGTSIASALRAFDELYARTPWPRAR